MTVDLRETSPASVASRSRRLPHDVVGLCVLVVVAVVIVAVGGRSLLTVATTAGIFAIAGVGLTVLTGTTRVVSLGSSAFVGLGAFTATYLMRAQSADYSLAIVLAVLACIALGAAVSTIANRLAGIYIAIITVGLAFIAQQVFRTATPWTGGTAGVQLLGLPLFGTDVAQPVALGGQVLDPVTSMFLLVAVCLIVTTLSAVHLLRSRIGRALHVIGTSAVTARSFGISPARYRSVAFVYSSALCGLSGALLAGQQAFVQWDQFNLILSIDLVVIIVLGGLGSPYGAIFASAIFYALPELVTHLRGVLPFLGDEGSTEGMSPQLFSSIIFGIALAAVVAVEPGGLAAVARRVRQAFSNATKEGLTQ